MPYVTDPEEKKYAPNLILERENTDLLAKIKYRLHFDEDEHRLNLGYTVWAALYEIDRATDQYMFAPNGRKNMSIMRDARGNQDDFVGWLTDNGKHVNTTPEQGSDRVFENSLLISKNAIQSWGEPEAFAINDEDIEDIEGYIDIEEDEAAYWAGSQAYYSNTLKFRAVIGVYPSLIAQRFSNSVQVGIGTHRVIT